MQDMADKQSREVGVRYTGGDNADKPTGTGALTVEVNVDVSEAITGLKAIQREAREAAKALRELEAELATKSITDDIRRSYE